MKEFKYLVSTVRWKMRRSRKLSEEEETKMFRGLDCLWRSRGLANVGKIWMLEVAINSISVIR